MRAQLKRKSLVGITGRSQSVASMKCTCKHTKSREGLHGNQGPRPTYTSKYLRYNAFWGQNVDAPRLSDPRSSRSKNTCYYLSTCNNALNLRSTRQTRHSKDLEFESMRTLLSFYRDHFVYIQDCTRHYSHGVKSNGCSLLRHTTPIWTSVVGAYTSVITGI